jgi:hypothetical protein
VNKQITTCAFDVKVNNGTTSASIQGYPKNVEVFSGTFDWRPYYYNGQATDEALSGRLRSRLGGYRIEGQMTWERQLNTTNFLAILNDAVTGTEKLFATNAVDGTYTSNTNIALASALGPDDALNGMRVDFNGSDTRTIVDYFNSNRTMILNSAVTLAGSQTANIYALSNMVPLVFINVDATSTRQEQVVLTESAFTASLQSTIVSQPVSVSFRGTNVETSIPTAYQL